MKGIIKIGDVSTFNEKITSAVNKGLTKFRDIAHTGGRMYLSDAGFCYRRNVAYGLIQENDLPPQKQLATTTMYMELGEAIHKIVCEALRNQNMLLFSEFKLPPIYDPNGNLDLGGRLDAFVVVDGKIRILEIKSCSEPKDIDPKHKQQAVNYSSLLGIPATLFYVSRNVIAKREDFLQGTIAAKEFAIEPTPEESFEAIRKLALSHFYLKEKVLPPIPFKTKSACSDCIFKDLCWVDKEKFSEFEKISDQTKAIIESSATTLTKSVLSPDAIQKRRNGVLAHIAKHGSPFAKEFLKGSWENIF